MSRTLITTLKLAALNPTYAECSYKITNVSEQLTPREEGEPCYDEWFM